MICELDAEGCREQGETMQASSPEGKLRSGREIEANLIVQPAWELMG